MFVLAGRSGEVRSLCLSVGLVPGLDGLGAPVYEGLVRLVVKETDEDAGHVVTAQAAHLTVWREAPAPPVEIKSIPQIIHLFISSSQMSSGSIPLEILSVMKSVTS